LKFLNEFVGIISKIAFQKRLSSAQKTYGFSTQKPYIRIVRKSDLCDMRENNLKLPLSTPIFIPIEGQDNPPEYPDLPSIPIGADIMIKACADAIGSTMNGMMREGVESFEEYKAGKIDEKQYTYRVVYKGTQAGVKGGTRTAAALGLSEGVKRLIAKQFGKEALRRLGRINLVTSLAFGVVDQTYHAYDFYQGKLSSVDFKVKSVENAGGTGGAISGAAVGAMLGSAVPGLGTATGAMLGYMMAVIGGMSGASFGKSLGEQWFQDEQDPKTPGDTNSKSGPIDIPID
jgi:hypothetical protein